jgi:hypothetical protein
VSLGLESLPTLSRLLLDSCFTRRSAFARQHPDNRRRAPILESAPVRFLMLVTTKSPLA